MGSDVSKYDKYTKYNLKDLESIAEVHEFKNIGHWPALVKYSIVIDYLSTLIVMWSLIFNISFMQ